MNLFHGELANDGGAVRLGDQALMLPRWMCGEGQVAGGRRGQAVVVGIRPEDLADAELSPPRDGTRSLRGKVELVEELGSEKLVHFRSDTPALSPRASSPAGDAGGEQNLSDEPAEHEETLAVARVPPSSRVAVGREVEFTVAVDHIHLFDPHSGVAIAESRRVQIDSTADA
jgi:multiple sugar transport system ATP-binding protein